MGHASSELQQFALAYAHFADQKAKALDAPNDLSTSDSEEENSAASSKDRTDLIKAASPIESAANMARTMDFFSPVMVKALSDIRTAFASFDRATKDAKLVNRRYLQSLPDSKERKNMLKYQQKKERETRKATEQREQLVQMSLDASPADRLGKKAAGARTAKEARRVAQLDDESAKAAAAVAAEASAATASARRKGVMVAASILPNKRVVLLE